MTKQSKMLVGGGVVAALLLAAVGLTYAATKPASPQQQPGPGPRPPGPGPSPQPPGPPRPPEPPPPSASSWQPATSIDPGGRYRVSVPAQGGGIPQIQTMLSAMGLLSQASIYPPGAGLPQDWPPSDSYGASAWRAEFSSQLPQSVQIPPGVTVSVWVFTGRSSTGG